METNLDASFPSVQFILEGYHTPYRGGILVYVRSSIPSRFLSDEELCRSIQAIPFGINFRMEKWLVISVYCPPLQNSEYFVDSHTNIINYFAYTSDNYLILGNLNLESTDSGLMGFLDSNNFTNLIKKYLF